MNVNVPASDPCGPPETGASTKMEELEEWTLEANTLELATSMDEHSRNSFGSVD
jgi:hypothetical protein